ncbi:MAG: hsp90 co-chaperone Cdc37 [Watsoniomyces obsoletus]|nr:MAG: hsp90 co-chaperone Cdc37 [Watsoniomyces obsoletus]
MALDYSKWHLKILQKIYKLTFTKDKLELSDDSDIEEHPNVDKRSFIRAKQAQIHQQRFQRRHEIQTLKYERIINEGLISRVEKLVSALEKGVGGATPNEQVYNALMELMSNPSEDQPPPRPEGVHSRESEEPSYSKMIAALVDQVKKDVDDSKNDDRKAEYIKKLHEHGDEIKNLQGQLETRLAELEREESRKITSDSIHTGFDSSFISKSDKKDSTKEPAKTQTETVEVLNPQALKEDSSAAAQGGNEHTTSKSSSAKPADAEDDDDQPAEATPLGKQFAKIKIGNYQACLQFISEHPDIVAPRETDGLLAEGFDAQLSGKDEYARQCVHQALLLQYCRSLGKDGVGLFFKRVLTAQNHKGLQVFHDDVKQTYARIRDRCEQINKQRAETGGGSGEVEQIQLQAVEPGTTITIVVPQPDSEDEVERQAREIFENFPEALQKALESGSLDEVNKVLATMSVAEAEEVVAQLGEGGMLSLNEEIIDATTEEGQQRLKELEEQRGAVDEDEDEQADEEAIGDPE